MPQRATHFRLGYDTPLQEEPQGCAHQVLANGHTRRLSVSVRKPCSPGGHSVSLEATQSPSEYWGSIGFSARPPGGRLARDIRDWVQTESSDCRDLRALPSGASRAALRLPLPFSPSCVSGRRPLRPGSSASAARLSMIGTPAGGVAYPCVPPAPSLLTRYLTAVAEQCDGAFSAEVEMRAPLPPRDAESVFMGRPTSEVQRAASAVGTCACSRPS